MAKTQEAYQQIAIQKPNHTPSWRRHGDHGHAELKLAHHAAAGWTSFDIEESYTNDETKKYVSKRTMVTIDAEANLRVIKLIAPGLLEAAEELLAHYGDILQSHMTPSNWNDLAAAIAQLKIKTPKEAL